MKTNNTIQQNDLAKMLLETGEVSIKEFKILKLVFEVYNKDESNEKQIKSGWSTLDLTNFDSWRTTEGNYNLNFSIDEKKLKKNLLDKALICKVYINERPHSLSHGEYSHKERFSLEFKLSLDFLSNIEDFIKHRFGYYLQREYEKHQELLMEKRMKSWMKRKEKEILSSSTKLIKDKDGKDV